MGIADKYRREQRGSLVPAIVAVGIGTLCVGGVALGLLATSATRSTKRDPPPWKIVLPVELEFRSRESLVREVTNRELRRQGLRVSNADAVIKAYGSDTYVVSGTYVKDDSLAVYLSTCRLVDDEWRVVKLQLPTQQIEESFDNLVKTLEDVGQ
jgi:hypothetical protein